MITLEDFLKIELKVAQIVEAKVHPNADKLLILTVDVGAERKEIVAGIAPHYPVSELSGKRVILVNNLQPATLRGVVSTGMILAAKDGETLSLVVPDRPVALGAGVR